jgi:hypothetical protein
LTHYVLGTMKKVEMIVRPAYMLYTKADRHQTNFEHYQVENNSFTLLSG